MTIGQDLQELPSFGRYQPLFRIAAGGMAEVYGARAQGEAGFHRWVALKRILPHLSEDARFVEMFLDEARLAANVQSMHVVPTLDLGRASDGSLYLVMDLVVGVTLSALIAGASRAGDLLAVPLVIEIVAQAAQGLHDAHEARSPSGEPLHIVHRDVSPRNILVGIDGRARILDFGIAQGELRATLTAVGELKGTQAYLSPEQAALAKLDRRSDVYALGIVLWEALLGLRLFRGEGLEGRRNEVPRVDSVRKALSPALADVVARALSVEREKRYQTAEDLALALRATMGPSWTDASTNDVSRAVRQYGAATIDRIEAGMHRSSLDRTSAETEAAPKQTTSRLRAYGTSFVGREHDLESLEKIALGPDRLVTLFGPGGMGKTRLAIELAQRVREHFPGGVVFCDVTEARTAEGICYVVGSALGVPAIPGGEARAAAEMLGGVIAARGKVLVLVDNVEQAMSHVGGTIGAWVKSAPRATFLVTSRERLRLDAETLYELSPLDLGTEVGGSAAARLFIDRATKVRRDLRLDAEAQRAIASIVKRLDGLPLAIELAASRVRVIDVVQLEAQLGERLRVPMRGARDASPRQATLDAAIRWSWDLLEPEEQILFASVSVFRGGFDARAACEIASPGGDPEVVEQMLEQLADKSLVRFGGGTPTRFGTLESMREFAARELAQRGATRATMDRYARYYGELAAVWDDPRTAVRPSEIERDLDNLVNAFGWTHDEPTNDDDARVHRLLLLALATEPVLGVRGPVSLARELLEKAVAACDGREAEADLDARARLGLARALFTAGQHADASAALAEARMVAMLAPDRRAEAWARLTEAEQHWARGNLGEVVEASRRAIEAGEAAGDLLLLARAHSRQGSVLLLRGDHTGAKESLQRARAIARGLRFEQLEARIDVTLADIAADLGDTTTAARVATSASQLAARAGDRWLEAYALMTLGSLALDRDAPSEALTLFRRAMQLTREAGHLRTEGLFLCFVGVAEECAGNVEEARATLVAAADANRRAANRLGEGLAHAYRARLLARTGAVEEAERAITAGVSILEEVGDNVRLVVARLCAAHIDLAKAEVAASEGELERAGMYRGRAQHFADTTRDELSSGRLHSLDVQHALRMLENDLVTRDEFPGARDTMPPD